MAVASVLALCLGGLSLQQLQPPGIDPPLYEERYDQVPFQGNLEARLRELLMRADEEADLAKLVEQLRKNPQLQNLDPAFLKELDTQNPALRGLMLDMARKFKDADIPPGQFEALREQVERQKEMIKQFMERKFDGGMGGPATTMPKPNPEMPAPPDLEARLTEWTKDFLKEVDQSRAGDFLRDSPAWQNALRDFERLVKTQDGQFKWLGGLPERWNLPEGWRLPEGWTPRLGDWSGRLPNLPELPRWRISAPRLGNWNFNFGGGPRLGTPSVGGVSFNENLVWVLLLVLLALLGWVFYQKLGRTPGTGARAIRRGPWPVNPALVTTRTQLIQAFDYLALLLLGDEVRPWNHVAVARKLGEQSARSPAASALAELYELARYTPGDDVLGPDAQAAARRHLVALARSAA